MQKFIFLPRISLTNLRQAELLQTAQKRSLKKYVRDDVKRNHPGKNRRETRMEKERERERGGEREREKERVIGG